MRFFLSSDVSPLPINNSFFEYCPLGINYDKQIYGKGKTNLYGFQCLPSTDLQAQWGRVGANIQLRNYKWEDPLQLISV